MRAGEEMEDRNAGGIERRLVRRSVAVARGRAQHLARGAERLGERRPLLRRVAAEDRQLVVAQAPDHVHVDHGANALQVEAGRRIAREGGRAEEPALLAREADEQHVLRELGLAAGEDARALEQRRGARGVVVGAVVDLLGARSHRARAARGRGDRSARPARRRRGEPADSRSSAVRPRWCSACVRRSARRPDLPRDFPSRRVLPISRLSAAMTRPASPACSAESFGRGASSGIATPSASSGRSTTSMAVGAVLAGGEGLVAQVRVAALVGVLEVVAGRNEAADEHDLALDVEAGVVVAVLVLGDDAVAGEDDLALGLGALREGQRGESVARRAAFRRGRAPSSGRR